MKLIDANVILRYLLRDIPDQANQAAALIHTGAYTSTEIMAEVVYVLQGLYQTPRGKISDALQLLLNELHLEDADVMNYALDIFRRGSLDFTDCLLVSRAIMRNADVFSFDKKLMKTIQEMQIPKI